MGEGSGVASFFHAAHGYVDHGHSVEVVMPGPASSPNEDTYRGMRLTRVRFGGDPLDPGPRGPAGFVSRLARYRRFRGRMTDAALRVARRARPDVVVALGPHAAPVARRVARACGVPNVTRLFGQALSLRMDERGRVRDRLRFHANFAEVIAFRTPCAALIVHDDGSRGDMVARHFGVPAERLHFWRDGFDIPDTGSLPSARELKERLGCRPEAVVALSLGRLSPEKDLHRVLAGFLAAGVPALELVFVGDGPLRDTLRLAADGKFGDRIHFHGAVVRDRLPEVLGAADFIVSLSNRTNMTNAVVEAMAFGVPPLVLDAGTTRAVVADGETGLVIDSAAPDEIAAAMRRIAADAALRRRLGAAAREFVSSAFDTVASRVQREVELVASIAARAGGGGS
jgi:glycosyltransferase involved in cell wall biosynthesis